jgi:hypothetical protein
MSFIPNNTPTPTPTPTPISLMTSIFDILIPIIILVIMFVVIGLSIYFIKKRLSKNNKKDMLFKDFNVGRYKILMFRKIGDKFVQFDTLKMDIKDNKFRYGEKDFTTFNINHIAYSDKKNNYYAFDYDSGSQLTFNEKGMPTKITIDDIDIYVNRKIIEQIVAGLEEHKGKTQWVMLILGIVIGCAIGIVIGLYMPKAGESVQQVATNTTQIQNQVYGIIEKVKILC